MGREGEQERQGDNRSHGNLVRSQSIPMLVDQFNEAPIPLHTLSRNVSILSSKKVCR